MFGVGKVIPGSLSIVYAVYDRLAEQCAGLFEAENDAVAIRFFRRGMADLSKREWDDYSLVKLGSMDHKSMELIAFREKEVINTPWIDREKE